MSPRSRYVLHNDDAITEIAFSPACPENNGLGEADIRAYDFISLYGLDSNQGMPMGVTVTEGSNELQKAYRLSSDVHVLSPTR